MMAITIAISACGKKNKVDNPVEEVATEVEEDKADEVVEKLSEADESRLKFEAFIAGDEKVKEVLLSFRRTLQKMARSECRKSSLTTFDYV